MSVSTRLNPTESGLAAPDTPPLFNVFWKDHAGRFHAGPRGVLEDHIDDAFQHYLVELLDGAADAEAVARIFDGHGMSASCPPLLGQHQVRTRTVIRFLRRESRPILVCNVKRGTVTGSATGYAVAFDVSRNGEDWSTCAELLSDDDRIVVTDASLSSVLTAAAGEVTFSDEEAIDVFASVEAWLRHDRRYNDDQPCIPCFWRFSGNCAEVRYGFGNAIDENVSSSVMNRDRSIEDCVWGERLDLDEALRLRLNERDDLLDLASIAESERETWSDRALTSMEGATGDVIMLPSHGSSPFRRGIMNSSGVTLLSV